MHIHEHDFRYGLEGAIEHIIEFGLALLLLVAACIVLGFCFSFIIHFIKACRANPPDIRAGLRRLFRAL